MPEKKVAKERLSCQQTLRLSPQMNDEILTICRKTGISFMDWVRGACQERLDRERMNVPSAVGKMTVEQLKEFIQKVMMDTDIETGNLSPSDVSRYDRVSHNQSRPFDLLDEFQELETEEEREEWAQDHLYDLKIEGGFELPEGMKIYGVLQGRIIYTMDGDVGFCRFEEMFPDYLEDEEGVEEEVKKEQK